MTKSLEVNAKQVQNTLNKLLKKIKHPRPIMADIGEIMFDDIMETFEREGRPHWKDLKKSTKKARAKKGWWPGKILNIHGSSGLVGSINYRATDTEVRIGTNKVYAPTLHYGNPGRRIPARPFMKLSDGIWYDIQEMLAKWLDKI